MSVTKSTPSTDSAAELQSLVGDDATADFEADPKFSENDPTASASSKNIAIQRDTDDTEESEEEIEEDEEDEDEEEGDEDEDALDEEDEEDDLDEDQEYDEDSEDNRHDVIEAAA